MTHKHSDILGDNFKINYDIKLAISSDEFKFYFWVNLWYACLDCIARFIIENMIESKLHNQTFPNNLKSEPKEVKIKLNNSFNITRTLSQEKTKTILWINLI